MHILTFFFATLVGCSWIVSSPLKYLLNYIFCGSESDEERRLRQEISSLRYSLQKISMADQFAAWAKLQRQITTQTKAYQQEASQRHASDATVRFTCSCVIEGIAGLLGVWYIWSSYSTPVATLPTYLVHPLGSLLAMPSCRLGEVSVLVWVACVRAVSNRLCRTLPGKSGADSSSMAALLPLLGRLIPQ